MDTRSIALTLAVLAAASACTGERLPSGAEEGTGTVRIALALPGGTRAGETVAATAAEKTVNRIDLFAYDHATGLLVQSRSATPSDVPDIMGVEMTVPKRFLDFYAVANGPADLHDGTLTRDGLLGKTSLFTGNSPSSFVMRGSALSVDAASATEIPVTLERIACKVVLKRMTKAFSSPSTQLKDVTLTDVRLVNVRKEVVLFDTSDPAPSASDASYINPRSFAETGTGMTGAAGLSYSVAAEGTDLGDGIALYFYPNAAAEADSAEGDDYVTKLVMTVDIDGTPYRYPVGLPQSAGTSGRNLVYQVENVTLNLLGNDESESPNAYLTKKAALLSLTVLGWDGTEVATSYADPRSVFTVGGVGTFAADSGTMEVTITSRERDLVGRTTPLAWTADISADGGRTFTDTFPAWLGLSPSSGSGTAEGGETVTLSWDKSLMGTVGCADVVVRFTQASTGRMVVRYMKES